MPQPLITVLMMNDDAMRYVCRHACIAVSEVSIYLCMYVCMYVCIYVCTYVCIHACVAVSDE